MLERKLSVVYHVHKCSDIPFERVEVMITMALIHLYFKGDSPLRYVKIKCC